MFPKTILLAHFSRAMEIYYYRTESLHPIDGHPHFFSDSRKKLSTDGNQISIEMAIYGCKIAGIGPSQAEANRKCRIEVLRRTRPSTSTNG
jgi:hypothetical protein